MSAPVRIVEEVPGVEPHWFVAGAGVRPYPEFDTHAEAVAWCEARGFQFVTERFEP